jgi:hypothetical protein
MGRLSKSAWQAVCGFVCLAAGVGLYLASVDVALKYYDEQPRPSWLTWLVFFAITLALVGLGLLVVSVVRGLREARIGSARQSRR